MCVCANDCECVCRGLGELSPGQTVPMQAVQAPEARISDVHQRNCAKAFIVIMDGQMPNRKALDIFSSLFYSSLLKMMCGTESRKNVSGSVARLTGITAFLSFLTPPSLTVCLSLSFITEPATETWKASNLIWACTLSLTTASFLPLHVLMVQSISGLPQHM